jgi:hypothetical protein
MKWSSQEPAVLQSYRRAYRLDTPSTFKNPLSHVVLGQGIGRFSPTMARPKSKRRVQKDQLALAVRKNFNALGVTESDVIVDWLYKSKHQGKANTIHAQPPIADRQCRQRVQSTIRAATEVISHRIRHAYTPLRCTCGVSPRYPFFDTTLHLLTLYTIRISIGSAHHIGHCFSGSDTWHLGLEPGIASSG